jgi:hypothetical protein
MSTLVLSMAIVGFVGGLANFLREREFKWSIFFRDILYAIIAVSTIPLFLNLISSSLVNEILNNINVLDNNYLVFIGFCALASLYSKTFLDRMYNKIIEDLSKVKKEVRDSNKDIKEIQENLEEKSIDIDNAKTQLKEKTNKKGSNDDDLINVMESIYLSNYKYRTLSGIKKDLKMEEKKINEILNELIEEGFIMTKVNKHKNLVYGLTNNGKDIFI